jgi:hypothetical protein
MNYGQRLQEAANDHELVDEEDNDDESGDRLLGE